MGVWGGKWGKEAAQDLMVSGWAKAQLGRQRPEARSKCSL